jgi:hypothetical protein
MEVRPPHLFSSDDHHGPRLTVVGDVTTAVVEMAVHGPWDRRLGADVTTATHKCLAEQPSALIADLRDLHDPDGRSAALWLAVRRACLARQPAVHLGLCVTPGGPLADRLTRLGVRRHVPVFPSPAAARAELTGRAPRRPVLQSHLPPEPLSASLALDLVGQGCSAWRLPGVLHPARRVLSELVTNAVEHARTPVLVTVSHRGPGLHLSVRDGDPRLPRLLPGRGAGPSHERGQGLRLVHAGASAWGAMPTHGGKVVWATVRPR